VTQQYQGKSTILQVGAVTCLVCAKGLSSALSEAVSPVFANMRGSYVPVCFTGSLYMVADLNAGANTKYGVAELVSKLTLSFKPVL
jgi:hypothetical protein